MPRIGYLVKSPHDVDTQLVGTKETVTGYSGPCARVEYDKKWLSITTDDHEGAAMLNIEALPFLIEALQNIEAKMKAEAS